MKRLLYILAIVAIITAVGWTVHSKQQSSVANNAVANVHQCLENLGEQVWIEGGTFTMGSEDFYREEGRRCVSAKPCFSATPASTEKSPRV